MKKRIWGGIHPPYNKEMSIKPDEPSLVMSKQLVIPLQQHIGAACKPLVKVGDYVLKGQKIGDGEGMCVPVHASASGKVFAIEPRPHPNGETVESVIIENDFKDSSVEFAGCDLPLDELDTDKTLHTIREAGIVGMGGAAFPGNIKAVSAMGSIDTLIANACECEPYITADDTLIRNYTKPLFEGMMILHRLLSPKRMVIAIEDNKPVAIEKLNALKKDYPLIEIAVLPTRYPQGYEKQTILAVTGRRVPPNGLPMDVGCVVFNISTFAAVYKAVRFGAPVFERIVTVSGEGVKAPQNFIVRIGTSFEDVINAAGGMADNTQCVISGGPMMGTAQTDLSVPVIKATSAVLCLPDDKNSKAENLACIRCGKCLSVCPMHLQPLYIARFADKENVKELKRLNVNDCMECGCCAFICPAKLPLVDKCRLGKKLVKEDNKK